MNLKLIIHSTKDMAKAHLNSHLWDYEPETYNPQHQGYGKSASQFPFMGL